MHDDIIVSDEWMVCLHAMKNNKVVSVVSMTDNKSRIWKKKGYPSACKSKRKCDNI